MKFEFRAFLLVDAPNEKAAIKIARECEDELSCDGEFTWSIEDSPPDDVTADYEEAST